MPPYSPNPKGSAPPPGTGPKSSSWAKTLRKANSVSNVVLLLVTVLIAGGSVGFGIALLRQQPATKQPSITNLSEEDLRKLTDIGTNLGSSNQTLNIGANALFRGKADIAGDLSVGGRFNANGPVTLSQLNISGTTALTGLNVGSNLIVGGTTTLQRGLTVQQLATFAGGITVNGTASFNTLNAGSIAVNNITISGPLRIGHLATQGPTPAASAGAAVGNGGTISISGNDTAGTININTGSGPSANTTLITVTFRAAFTTAPHVLLTPRTAAAAGALAYVVPTSTGFRILAVTPPAGQNLSFDYLVAQ